MNTAFIIGNGSTRENLPLEDLKGHGTIYGCNALYRDYPAFNIPDYLVAIDPEIIKEIRESDFPNNRFIIPPYDEQFEPEEYSPLRFRSNAGMNSMLEAIKADHNFLYCIGFDFIFKDIDIASGNVYDGTPAYDESIRATENDCENRMKYLSWFMRKHSNVSFIFVVPKKPLELRNYQGTMKFIFEDCFMKMIHTEKVK